MLELKQYRDGINFFKALAILHVTYFHLWRTLGRKTLEVYNFDVTLPFHLGHLGVNLFVFIAGLLVIPSIIKYDSVKPFIFSKLKSLSPLYFIAILFYFVFAINGFSLNKYHDLTSVLLHVTYTHTLISSTTYSLSGVLWYMGLIIQLYLFGYFCYQLYKYNKNLTHVLVILTHFATFYFDSDIIATRFIGKYTLIFYIGMLSYLNFDSLVGIFNKKSFVIVITFILCVFLFYTKVPKEFNFKYMSYSQAFIFLFFPYYLVIIYNLSKLKNGFFSFVCYIGVISYPLYLFNYSYQLVGKSVKVSGFHALIFYTIFLFIMAVIFHEVNNWIQRRLK